LSIFYPSLLGNEQAQEAADNIDVKAVVRALFGGGEFDDIIGDAGEIPLLRRMVEKAGEMDDEDEDEDQDLDKLSEEEAKAKLEKMKVRMPAFHTRGHAPRASAFPVRAVRPLCTRCQTHIMFASFDAAFLAKQVCFVFCSSFSKRRLHTKFLP
jgi:hypothetical protein